MVKIGLIIHNLFVLVVSHWQLFLIKQYSCLVLILVQFNEASTHITNFYFYITMLKINCFSSDIKSGQTCH